MHGESLSRNDYDSAVCPLLTKHLNTNLLLLRLQEYRPTLNRFHYEHPDFFHGSSASRAMAVSSSGASITSIASSPSPSPSGPPSRMNPSSVSLSMNAACSVHSACSRRSLVESQDGPLPWTTMNLVFMSLAIVTQPLLVAYGASYSAKLNLYPAPDCRGSVWGRQAYPLFLSGLGKNPDCGLGSCGKLGFDF
jgi:hypothetical protein